MSEIPWSQEHCWPGRCCTRAGSFGAYTVVAAMVHKSLSLSQHQTSLLFCSNCRISDEADVVVPACVTWHILQQSRLKGQPVGPLQKCDAVWSNTDQQPLQGALKWQQSNLAFWQQKMPWGAIAKDAVGSYKTFWLKSVLMPVCVYERESVLVCMPVAVERKMCKGFFLLFSVVVLPMNNYTSACGLLSVTGVPRLYEMRVSHALCYKIMLIQSVFGLDKKKLFTYLSFFLSWFLYNSHVLLGKLSQKQMRGNFSF